MGASRSINRVSEPPLEFSKKSLIFSLAVHALIPLAFFSSQTLERAGISLLSKKRKALLEQQKYESFVQVDVVALPEAVGIKNKFVDTTLPVVKNPVTPKLPAPKAQEKAETKDEDIMKVPGADEEAKKREAKKKELERIRAAEKKKKEREKKKFERDRKNAMKQLQKELERQKAMKALESDLKGKQVGREAISGNVLSQGTQTVGKQGTASERYQALVQAAIRANFNVAPWVKNKALEAHVVVQINRSGAITGRQLELSSGNKQYDSDVLQAVDRTGKLPPPESETIIEEGIGIVFKP